jgi:hypothetical protein
MKLIHPTPLSERRLTMKRLLAISALLFAASAFAAPNLIRQWTIHSNIAENETDQECKLVVTDYKITGTCKTLWKVNIDGTGR